MDHYNKGDGLSNPYLDEDMQPLALTETDIDDVVAFLASLTGAEYHDAGVKELERPRVGPSSSKVEHPLTAIKAAHSQRGKDAVTFAWKSE
jgi:hypothetical protein